uniref:Uncharacterized protein n=1 Tax=Physcomitrium patens TaxID=3218 RepID=A0A2K1KBQ1_PHYPA|nr:hypothetical protein PHYPA_010392 [Physcomitrium patens]
MLPGLFEAQLLLAATVVCTRLRKKGDQFNLRLWMPLRIGMTVRARANVRS